MGHFMAMAGASPCAHYVAGLGHDHEDYSYTCRTSAIVCFRNDESIFVLVVIGSCDVRDPIESMSNSSCAAVMSPLHVLLRLQLDTELSHDTCHAPFYSPGNFAHYGAQEG